MNVKYKKLVPEAKAPYRKYDDDAIGGDLEAILEKSYCPAYDNGDENRLALEVFQVPVPSISHKQVRANKHYYRCHPSHKKLILKFKIYSRYPIIVLLYHRQHRLGSINPYFERCLAWLCGEEATDRPYISR